MRISSLFCLLAWSFTFVAQAQQWSEVNDPIATRQVYYAQSFQNKLWILDDGNASQGPKASALRLKTWNNSSWNTYPEYIPSGVDSLHGGVFIGVDTSVYIAYQSFSNGSSSAGLLRFDIPSEKWTEISSFNAKLDNGAEIRAMAWYNNDLYLAGDLTSYSGSNQLIRVKHDFAFAEVYGEVRGSISYLGEYQGNLYLAGKFDSIGMVGSMLGVKNLSLFQPDIFITYSGGAGEIDFLKPLAQGELVFQEVRAPEERYLNLLSASLDRVMNYNFPKTFSILDYEIHKNQHFAIQISNSPLFGPGIYRLDALSERWVSLRSKLDPSRSMFVQAGSKLYLIELSGNSYHIEVNTLAYLAGRVFVDVDGDCAKTAGDRMMDDELIIKDKTSGRLWLTQAGSGIFGSYVGEGNYELGIPNIPVRLSTSICSSSKLIQVQEGDSIFVDIPLSIIDTTPLVKISISSPRGFRARQGFVEEYDLHIYNEGFRVQNCPVTLQMPKEIQFLGADIMPIDSGLDGTYTWNLTVAPFQEKHIHFMGSVALSTPSYTKVKISAWSDSACLRADNKDSLVLKVVGAFDPNDKQNFPESIITKKTKEIKYHIRFQNTGTDTALNVYVIDTLDIKLPMAYVKLDGVSHPYTIDPGPLAYGVQIYSFENIMLPDSGTNMEASMGYISYHIALIRELNHGDIIVNRAYIYFDYQHPIITNTVENEMQDEESGDIPIVGVNDSYVVYPNPSKGQFNVVNFTKSESTCMLFDSQGKALGTWALNADGETLIDLTRLSQGVYFLRFPDWNAQESLVITH